MRTLALVCGFSVLLGGCYLFHDRPGSSGGEQPAPLADAGAPGSGQDGGLFANGADAAAPPLDGAIGDADALPPEALCGPPGPSFLSCTVSVEVACPGGELDGDYIIETASDLRELGEAIRAVAIDGQTHMTGSLTVTGSELTDLEGLQGLTCIGGSLRIEGCAAEASGCEADSALSDLSALRGLRAAGGLEIRLAVALASLDGLSDLGIVRGDLVIAGNPLLRTLEALGSLWHVGGSLRFEKKCYPLPSPSVSFTASACLENGLEDLGGLDRLASIGEDLVIADQPALGQIGGLNALECLGGSLVIGANQSLVEIDGLKGLGAVPGHLIIGSWSVFDELLALGESAGDVDLQEVIEVDSGNPLLGTISGLQQLNWVGGDLVLSGNGALGELAGLGGVIAVGGSLRIRDNGALEDFEGLGNLAAVCDRLSVRDNGALADLSGPRNGAHIGGTVEILGNPSLVSLQGIHPAERVRGDLWLSGNPRLVDLSSLGTVTAVEGEVLVENNATLTDLSGLGALTVVEGDLSIQNNAALMDLSGLGALGSVEGNLIIWENDLLPSLSGLEAITRIDGFLIVFGNPGLSDVSALGSAELGGQATVFGVILIIAENRALPRCEAVALEQALIYQGAPGTAAVCQNLPDNCGEMSCDTLY